MNQNQVNPEKSAYTAIGRSLGRSRKGQLFAAAAVAGLFSWLAYVAWHVPNFAAIILSIGLLVYGLQMSWRLLPIPSATRARWVREEQIARRHPAHSFRGLLWAGIGISISEFWRSGPARPFEPSSLIAPGVFVVIGTVSYILCRRFIRNERNA